MNCEQLEKLVAAYVDGELSRTESAQVRSHAFECPTCATTIEAERLVKQTLSGLPTIEPPKEFESRLFEAVLSTKTPTRKVHFAVGLISVCGLACGITLALLRTQHQDPANPAGPTYELRRDEAYMAGMDPYGGGSMVYTTSYER